MRSLLDNGVEWEGLGGTEGVEWGNHRDGIDHYDRFVAAAIAISERERARGRRT